MNFQELSSRTMFYHSQMMNGSRFKIFKFKLLLPKDQFLMPLFLRKAYKHFFGIERTVVT